MNIIKSASLKISSVAVFSYLLLTEITFAQGPEEIVNPIKINSIDALITEILRFVVMIGSPIIVLAIIYAGFMFVFARGDTTKLAEAQKTLWYTLIGALIVLGAQALKVIITGTVGNIQGSL